MELLMKILNKIKPWVSVATQIMDQQTYHHGVYNINGHLFENTDMNICHDHWIDITMIRWCNKSKQNLGV